MSAAPPNLNLRRRPFPGFLALAAALPLRVLLFPLRRKPAPEAPLLVFSAYMIGDLFMALPALKRLASVTQLRVVCRPDCAELLRREGLDPVPFDNAFFTRRTPAAFFRTLRAAWRLRALPASTALDLDADPRTGLWMRIAGASRVVSYRRPFGVLFDETFTLPPNAIHQADKDRGVEEEFLQGWGMGDGGRRDARATHGSPLRKPFLSSLHPPWLLSVWTRKPQKNWPLDRWETLMERMEREGVPFAVLDAPDGDLLFRAFKKRWQGRGRTEFVAGTLEEVAERVRSAAGVVATDNFLGHMGGYYGKPVLWINVCSPAAQVEPRGPRTLRVGGGSPGFPEVPDTEAVWQKFVELRAESREAIAF